MLGFKRDGLQDQKVERPLDKIVRFRHTMVIYNTDCRLSRHDPEVLRLPPRAAKRAYRWMVRVVAIPPCSCTSCSRRSCPGVGPAGVGTSASVVSGRSYAGPFFNQVVIEESDYREMLLQRGVRQRGPRLSFSLGGTLSNIFDVSTDHVANDGLKLNAIHARKAKYASRSRP
jgi:hypothetical protein